REESFCNVVNPGSVDLGMAEAAQFPAGKVIAALGRIPGKSRTAEATALFPCRSAGDRGDEVDQVPAGGGRQHVRVRGHRPRHDTGRQPQPDVLRPTAAAESPGRSEIARVHCMAGSVIVTLAAATVVAVARGAPLVGIYRPSAGHALRRTWDRS